MRIVDTYRRNGRLVTRVYTKPRGRPKGTKNSSYNLSEKGRKVKRKVYLQLLARLRKEGRIGSGYFRNHPQTAEHRAKNSKGVLAAIADGRLNPGRNIRNFIAEGASKVYLATRVNHGMHGMFYSRKNGKRLRYDSLWELIRMAFLETQKTVVSYQKNPIQILYHLNGKAHYYWPDFLIQYENGSRILEEIKPKAFLKYAINRAKFRAARAFCKSAPLRFRIVSSKADLRLCDSPFLQEPNCKRSAEMTDPVTISTATI